MITIIQQKDKYGWCYCLVKSDGEPIDHAYAIGFDPPHHSMPAIRYVVDWFIDVVDHKVVIFRVYTGDDYELPEIVKHW